MEVDISHTDIDKNELYAAMGVPEFWRFDGRTWRIYRLEVGGYEECDCPPTFPMVAKERLYQFLDTCLRDEVEAELEFRAWVKEQVNP